MILTCYSCEKSKPYDNFRYSCNCTDNMGVCKQCILDGKEVDIPKHHTLEAIHDYTKEYTDWMKKLDEISSGWTGLSMRHNTNGQKIYSISFYEGPNGERGDEFKKWAGKQPINPIFDDDLRKQCRKEVQVLNPPKKICTCC